MMQSRYTTLRLVLGDQLNASHHWYQQPNEDVLYVIAELKQESNYVTHHHQKICAFFAAMENFAIALQQAGHEVLHLSLDDTHTYHDLPDLILSLCQQYHCQAFEYQQPDEYRLSQQLAALKIPDVTVQASDSDHFLLTLAELDQYITPNKHHRMEHFYRAMRKRFDVLMVEGKPQGGKWNFDGANRNKLKAGDIEHIPQPLMFSNDVSAISKRLEKHNINTIGQSCEQLLWPTNRKQSQALLSYFCRDLLPMFGRFQDAMTTKSESAWSLYHSRLSFALNTKMLHPMQVIQAAIDAYSQPDSKIDIAQVEGFVRQILGWREFIRAIYWVNMPHYGKENTLEASGSLPDFFWDAKTNMQCMHHAIKQSLDYSYAHHIQRLMVTGNFCLLTGITPSEVEKWYLGIYIDAIEWVEKPNTLGMALFADAGVVATKPYAASGAYINKMSDYCSSCQYDVKKKTGLNACPFNSLYWRFMDKNRELLANNPRVGMLFSHWDKLDDSEQSVIVEQAEYYLRHINSL
ncbi:cryptochrome/photolyase family protein [Photobacterium angustum]|uniref:cryptochrome/photolyase family protein n=1 Tax=Photobacterium angustum TaxID=661 RepID=UPI0005E7B230|nr:cryptochrome/photolyase family protein [Photobacterium angustum]KJG15664.1 deoxyribodipyrimidine photolyase [Photobacterium angustum]KJG21155.1 deoxyribodipyrimidine photolyase [Photobacterium angustum]KJG28016.1 deoxyribodipyrimidine photolyase [Photobacterium angustum]PSW97909.1 cryptochrome/photolyase family protein [Photobacterium angustum]PSX01962.1 cryptochrome/photolyase family protein [Photobacterium angustum]